LNKTWSTPVHAFEEEIVSCALCGGNVFNLFLKCEGFGYVRCKCGLVQMNPQPKKDDLHARYSSTYGKDYLQYELKNESAFLKLQQLALKDAGFKFNLKDNALEKTFLDIGCATGALLAYLKECGFSVTGVEISPSAEYAVKQRGLDVKSLPLEDNSFPNESFDTVHASHLIEHLKDPRGFLTEAHRIIKPAGCLFITTPNISGFQARLFGNRWRSAIFDHLYLFSVRTLIKLLKSTGYKVKCIRTWGGLAAGTAPGWLKKTADFLAKVFGFGDVMIVRCEVIKPN
jgi:2-polyprenyl-3-methyl-5-hydroxy-6-metoxy-1,4-benzoquinol methylase